MGIILHVKYNPWVYNMETFYVNSSHTMLGWAGTRIMVMTVLDFLLVF